MICGGPSYVFGVPLFLHPCLPFSQSIRDTRDSLHGNSLWCDQCQDVKLGGWWKRDGKRSLKRRNRRWKDFFFRLFFPLWDPSFHTRQRWRSKSRGCITIKTHTPDPTFFSTLQMFLGYHGERFNSLSDLWGVAKMIYSLILVQLC